MLLVIVPTLRPTVSMHQKKVDEDMRKPIIKAFVVATAAALLLSACSSSSAEAEPGATFDGEILVAVIADLTGGQSATQATAAGGFEAAVDAINAAGGIGGKKVVMTTYDSLSTPEGVQTAARQAAAEEPSFIAFAAGSSGLVGAQAVFAQAGIPLFSVSAAGALLFDDPQEWYFTVGSTPPQLANSILGAAEQTLDTLDGAKFAFHGLDSSTINGLWAELTPLLEAEGAEVVDVQKSTVGAPITNYTAQAQKFVELDADAVVVFDLSENFPIVVEAIADAGFEGPVLGGEPTSTDTMFERLANERYFGGRALDDARSGSGAADAAKAAGVASDGVYFPAGWVIGQIFAAAAAQVDGDVTAAALIEALENLGEINVPGDVTFGPVELSTDRHYAITTHQFFVWDAAAGEVVPFGTPVPLP